MLKNLSNFLLPPAKSTIAPEIDRLFNFINIVGLILLIIIVVTILYMVIKYHRRSDDDVTSLVDHNTILEVTWTIIPLVLILIVFAWGFRDYVKLYNPPDDSYEVNVTGQQWLWQFHYKNGKTSSKELHVPVNKPIKLLLKSKDVIHSFFVPDFRIKHDVLPDRYSVVWFQATDTGRFDIFCTQYCGLGHSNMLGKVVVQTQQNFDKWLKQGSQGKPVGMSDVAYGQQLYKNLACSSCHSVNGTKIVGPSWKGIFGTEVALSNGTSVKVDENYIRESIVNPGAQIVKGFPNVMPSFQGQLSDQQINAIIAYIKSLK